MISVFYAECHNQGVCAECLCAECLCAECHYADCWYAEGRGALIKYYINMRCSIGKFVTPPPLIFTFLS